MEYFNSILKTRKQIQKRRDLLKTTQLLSQKAEASPQVYLVPNSVCFLSNNDCL